jgi:hypothetical protein
MGKLEYTHLKINEDVTCISGYYTPLKEVRLPYNDKEVLYVVGQAVVESSCCGVGCWGYVLVPGHIINWQNKINEAGLPVSEVEPVSDKITRDDISQIINEVECIPRVEFW